jgi:hypothetical protein
MLNSRRNYNNRKAKAIAAMPLATILLAAAILSALLFVGTINHTALAQQNITGSRSTAITDIAASSSTSACVPTQTRVGGGSDTTTAMNLSSTTSQRNQTTLSEVRMHLEEACMAAQNDDMQGVFMHLNLALKALGGGSTQENTNSTTGSTTHTTTGTEAVVHGRAATGPSDDYDATADDDG